MDYRFLWILVAALLLIIVGLLLRMNLYKKQLHSFTEQLRFFRKEKKDGLISVESFGKDYIDLAKELQQFVDEEQELIEQSEKDRQSVKHMVAGISHDFRTPLTSAMGYIQLAEKDESVSEETAASLRKAYDKTKYLKELSDEFFALSVMENRSEEELTELSFKKLGGSKKLGVTKTGKIAIKKGTKKGTYVIKIKITAKGNSRYKPKTIRKTVTIKVR